jgi:C4-type Zn-finger protein
MSSGIHCDGPTCESWAKIEMGNRSGFITVVEGLIPTIDANILHFCSWDCINNYDSFFRQTIIDL